MDMEQYGSITKYAISAYKHKDEYDLHDAESVVTDFLSNAKNRLLPIMTYNKSWIYYRKNSTIARRNSYTYN